MFGRKKNSISGASEYVRATDTVSRPMAIVMVLFIVCAVVAAAFSLYLGGKWVYERWRGDDNSTTTTTQTTTGSSNEQKSDSSAPASTTPPVSSESSSSTTSAGTTTSGSGGASSSTNASGSASTASGTPGTSSSTTPTTGSSSDLPSTGPENIMAVFVVSTIIGTVVHYAILSRRS